MRETLRDVQFLHNDQFFAAAQKKYVYIYDKRGIEVHCLKARSSPTHRYAVLPRVLRTGHVFACELSRHTCAGCFLQCVQPCSACLS